MSGNDHLAGISARWSLPPFFPLHANLGDSLRLLPLPPKLLLLYLSFSRLALLPLRLGGTLLLADHPPLIGSRARVAALNRHDEYTGIEHVVW
jgi:hypothetical protein